jgi:hypothetical protein
MAIKRIEFLSFNQKENPDLIAKLNAVAPYEYLAVHTLAKRVLMGYLDKKIAEYGIPQDQIQPAACAG